MSESSRADDRDRPRDGRGNGDGDLTIPQFYVPELPRDTKRHDTPWILVRTDIGDGGSRPLAGGSVFWESPDVWVESSLGVNRPVPGEDNSVLARISNLGLEQANGVVVKFWWANPSVAITETSAHAIGVGFVDLPAGRSAVVKCPTPWVPVIENDGHECLLVEAYVPHYDELTAPMDPVLDRHVGQKNEQLVIARPREEVAVSVHAANISRRPETVVIDVLAVESDTVPEIFKRFGRLPGRKLLAPTVLLPLELAVRRDPERAVEPSKVFARRAESSAADGAGAAPLIPVPRISKTVDLEPWESVTLELTGEVPGDVGKGQTFLFWIVQRVGEIVTGGYSVAVVVE